MTVVLGMVECDGTAIVKVVPDATKPTLQSAIKKAVVEGTEVHTDAWLGYKVLEDHGYDVKRVSKYQGDGYVGPNGETVNAMENFWRHLKCSIKGTHTSIAAKYPERYTKEFECRFNRRMRPDSMMDELLSRFPELDA